MKPFEYLSHTADAEFRAYGHTIEEAFGNAAIAMCTLMADLKEVRVSGEKRISAEGIDDKALLYSFLEEIIFMIDSEGFMLTEVKSISIDGTMLVATIVGGPLSGVKTHGEVKAVTYNSMSIRKESNKYVIQVVVDM